LRWSTSVSPRLVLSDMGTRPTTHLSGDPPLTGPSERAIAEFSRLASKQQMNAVAKALWRNGIMASIVDTGQLAREAVQSLLPVGSEVFNNTSRTLEVIGVAEDIERSGRYQPLRPRLYRSGDATTRGRARLGCRQCARSDGSGVSSHSIGQWEPARSHRLGRRACDTRYRWSKGRTRFHHRAPTHIRVLLSS
jgi:hypothetical protein